MLGRLADLRKKTPLSILKRRNISQSSIHAGFKRFLPFKNVTRSFTDPPKNVTRCFLTSGLPLRRERSSSPDQSVICNASALRGYRRIENGHQKKTKTLNTKKPCITMLCRAGREKAPDMPGRWKVEGAEAPKVYSMLRSTPKAINAPPIFVSASDSLSDNDSARLPAL